MIQVLLVEDHSLVTEGIRSMISETKDIVCAGSFTNGHALLQKLRSFAPDVIIMDINLPDTNGIELCTAVKASYPAVNIVALSINNQPAIIRKIMEAGAVGYVLKDAAQQEIIEAIRMVAKGKEYFSRSATVLLRQPEKPLLPSLTRREKEILEKIADGLTNPQIAEILFLDVSTINSHRKNMIAKYNVQNTAALIKLAITEKLI
ncbi:MAG: response regulator transcription factor [Ferruginibacter sp.]